MQLMRFMKKIFGEKKTFVIEHHLNNLHFVARSHGIYAVKVNMNIKRMKSMKDDNVDVEIDIKNIEIDINNIINFFFQ